MNVEQQAELTAGSDFWHTAAVAGLPSVLVTDGPHGVRKQAADGQPGPANSEPATCFPPAVALGASWDVELMHRVGRALGREARSMGVSVLLGPGINLKRTPLGGRNFEYFSEDPQLTGRLASAWVEGLQEEGVGASLKHFAVNSQETDRMRISADLDERTLREVYLRAFQRVVQHARPWTVMCSYNRINGVHAAQNHWLLTEVLREEWGFEGAVVSDWGAVVDRVAAVAAGLDLTMPGPDPAGSSALVQAVADGELEAGVLQTAADRVRRLVERATSAAASAGQPPAEQPGYDVDAHHALAREAAGRAVVLLRNEGDLLPLRPDGGTIAVIGEYARSPRIQGGGSSHVRPTRVDTALAAITAASSAAVTFAAGYRVEGIEPDDEPPLDPAALVAEAVQVARQSGTVVLFLGTPEETEGADLTSLDLPADQLALLGEVAAANPRTVVVLTNGAVVLTAGWDRSVPAVLETWLLGQAGGAAVADVLFGAVNPSGRLAETVPLALADHPSYFDVPGEAGHVRYGEGIHIGHRGFDARDQQVAYPFGFGLSYTTFAYGQAEATEQDGGVELRVPVTNTGARDGREIVQVYLERPESSVRHPVRELVGFAAAEVPVGATVGVVVRVDREDLSYWHPRLRRWVLEPGEHRFAVGASSRDLRTRVGVELAGDDTRVPLEAGSTISEWLSDPRGAEVLGGYFFSLMAEAGEGASSAAMADPGFLQLISGLPLSRLAAFPGSPLTPQVLADLVAAAN